MVALQVHCDDTSGLSDEFCERTVVRAGDESGDCSAAQHSRHGCYIVVVDEEDWYAGCTAVTGRRVDVSGEGANTEDSQATNATRDVDSAASKLDQTLERSNRAQTLFVVHRKFHFRSHSAVRT